MRPLTQRHTLALLRTDISCLTWLRALWFFGVLWCEVGVYRFVVFRCAWPDRRLSPSTVAPTHVLILADPQVRHVGSRRHSCFFPRLHDWFYHASLRKNWRYVIRLNPDAVVFLGDMLASGRKLRDDDEFVENYLRFRRIFSVDKSVPIFHVPGNEDVGLNLIEADARAAQRRYTTHFDPLNGEALIANHSFVFINAPGLVEEDYHRARHVGSKEYSDYTAEEGGTVEFVRELARKREGQDEPPTVLFTHIPLSRPDGASCGPLREQGTMRRGAGPGYQNMHGKRTSEFLLDTLRPELVFSGDDRDYCDYTHLLPGPDSTVPVREVTVKSFSPDKTIRTPGFHLLSLIPPHATPPGNSLEATLADSPCFLPSQSRIHNAIYFPFAILMLLFLIARRVRERRERYHLSPLPSYDFNERVLTGSALHYKVDKEKVDKRSWRKPSVASSVPVSASSFGGGSHFPRRFTRRITGCFASNGAAASGPLNLSANQARLCRASWKVVCLSVLDFVKVLLPSLLLWSIVMWSMLH